jgi:hypothetical protein
MKHLSLLRTSPPRLAAVALALCCAAAAAASRAWLAPATAEAETASASAPLPPPDTLGEVELVTLRPTGFEPRELRRPAGRFLLAVTKRDLAEDVTLRLLREAGGSLREVRVARGRRHYREALDLAPGRYVLTTVERPDWACEVTILPR